MAGTPRNGLTNLLQKSAMVATRAWPDLLGSSHLVQGSPVKRGAFFKMILQYITFLFRRNPHSEGSMQKSNPNIENQHRDRTYGLKRASCFLNFLSTCLFRFLMVPFHLSHFCFGATSAPVRTGTICFADRPGCPAMELSQTPRSRWYIYLI